LFAFLLLTAVVFPATALARDECNPIIWVDAPAEGSTVRGAATLGGWALDTLEAPLSSGISSMQVYLDGEAGSGGTYVGVPAMGNKPNLVNAGPELLRVDVDQAYSRINNRSGWTLVTDFSTVAPGRHALLVYAETQCGWKFVRVNVNVEAGAAPVYQPTAPTSAGQTTNTALYVNVESPTDGSTVRGSRTFTGSAVDCAAIRPATRIRVYDGTTSSGVLLGEAQLVGTRDLAMVCPGRTGPADAGFSYSLDSNRLSDGSHTLAFVADFSTGSAVDTVNIYVDNRSTAYNAYRYYYGNTGYGNTGCYNGSYRPNYGGYYGGYNGYYAGSNSYYGNDYLYGNGGCYNNSYNSGYNSGYYGGSNGYYNNGRYCISYDYRGVCTQYSSGYYGGYAPAYGNCASPYNTGLYGNLGGVYPGTAVPYSSYYSYYYGLGAQNCGYPITSNIYAQYCVLTTIQCVNNQVASVTLTANTNPVPKNTTVPLGVTVTCTYNLGVNNGANTVTVTDITTGTSLAVGTVTTTGGIATLNWNTTGLGGTTRILQATVTGGCGNATQQFTFSVAA